MKNDRLTISSGQWALRPRFVRLAWIVCIPILLMTLVAEVFVDIHPVFGVDGSFGFHSWFGALSCVALVAVSKLVGLFLKRRDAYYDD